MTHHRSPHRLEPTHYTHTPASPRYSIATSDTRVPLPHSKHASTPPCPTHHHIGLPPRNTPLQTCRHTVHATPMPPLLPHCRNSTLLWVEDLVSGDCYLADSESEPHYPTRPTYPATSSYPTYPTLPRPARPVCPHQGCARSSSCHTVSRPFTVT
ncbi:hypothetical protein Pcinc_017764 [Petrolisthes cinctipes]|uniref:Uncharacterized protein n=1 Tax=Petrolisthes cinctipes TaxID=88211 RepID=A0AAE1KK42_PETCI|nr:hypothetical protein Pcinc_017764 [Petrolisthes cinctipes]